MSKFCMNCGKEISAGTAFCPNCGTKVADSSGNNSDGTEMKQYLPFIIGGSVGFVVILILIIVLLTTGSVNKSYQKVSVAACSGVFNGSVSKLKKAVLPEYYEDKLDNSETKLKELADSVDGKIKCSFYEKKDYSDTKFRNLKEEIEDKYDVTIDDAMIVTIKMTAKGEENPAYSDVTVIKVGKKYYVYNFGIESFVFGMHN